MHSRQLVELAAWIASNGASLIRTPAPLSAAGLNAYWSATRCRLDRWNRALKTALPSALGDAAGAPRYDSTLTALIEEVLTGEVLSRITAAVLTAYDRRQAAQEYEPVARNLLQGQLDARQRVLSLIVRSPQLDAEQAVEMNRLRRRCERWNDLLIGKLLLDDPVEEFAIDPERAAEFAEALRQQHRQIGSQTWPILLGSLRAAFQTSLAPTCPNPDLNERIAAGLLSCFPSEFFDGQGLIPSLWLIRMTHTTSDAQGMIADLISLERAPAAAPDSAAIHPDGRVFVNRPRRFDGP
ncbi:MAG TPA: hypothetical protein VFE24_13470 [Pirellulales bacterium]|jgi:hypothetical protein|nr:hypothetical protein [Pirellulales bacterium]